MTAKQTKEARIYVRPEGLRPDFRLVISFLWGDMHNCDTEGNSHNPASREWTELYCQNREASGETFDVAPMLEDPLTLEVTSDDPALAARVTYFLVVETQGTWANNADGPFFGPEELQNALGEGFSLTEATQRARESVWRKATPDNPYPNLDGSS